MGGDEKRTSGAEARERFHDLTARVELVPSPVVALPIIAFPIAGLPMTAFLIMEWLEFSRGLRGAAGEACC
jgi:hypothetical protein